MVAVAPNVVLSFDTWKLVLGAETVILPGAPVSEEPDKLNVWLAELVKTFCEPNVSVDVPLVDNVAGGPVTVILNVPPEAAKSCTNIL